MEIRIRETAAVISEREFRATHPNSSMPKVLSEALLDSLGADPVFEGPQVGNLEFWQFSQRNGVENIEGKWYTKYIAGPLFYDNDEATAAEQQAAYIAQKQDEKDKADKEALKTTGIEINDVLCSATKEDQNGLSAVAIGVTLARMAGEVFPATEFSFSNGNKIVITDANFNDIYAKWVPFRQSFFAVNS